MQSTMDTWTATEVAYFEAMERARWSTEPFELIEMWGQASSQDLLIVADFLTELARQRAATELSSQGCDRREHPVGARP